MKYININFWISLLLIGLINCTNPQKVNTRKKEANKQPSELNFLKTILGKPLETLDLPTNFQKRDTTFEAEDGTIWPGLIILQNNQILFFVETSWVDTINVRNLTIVSPQITLRDTLHVNSKFAEIKSFLDKKIPFAPDGYFCLKDKSDGKISYYFDIEGFPEFDNRQPRFDSIPENLVIKTILLN